MARDFISPERIDQILREFCFDGEFVSYEPHGSGHINDTFLLTFEPKVRYILQRVNHNIFKDVPRLMQNFELVTKYLATEILKVGGDPKREALQLILTKSGGSYVLAQGEYFRAFVFIEDATSHQVVENAELMYQAGKAFGKFARLLDGFDATLLHEAISDFHNTPKRFETFLKVLEKDSCGRAAECKPEIDAILTRRGIIDKITSVLGKKIPLRVTHNDTKLNNVMMDNQTMTAAAVIDLDTVMPGSLLYDFGDSIRSGCNTAAEDEKDLALVNFNRDYYEAYKKGYLEEMGEKMTDAERELLGFSAILMTLECGMRFLTDYLDGDNYFKTKYPEHNLVRARTQIKLVEQMETILV